MRRQILAVFIASVVLALGTLLIYAWSNRSGHTAFDPYNLFALFLPAAFVGLALMFRHPEVRLASLLLITLAIIGMITVVVLDQTNTLVEYERWLKRGMP